MYGKKAEATNFVFFFLLQPAYTFFVTCIQNK